MPILVEYLVDPLLRYEFMRLALVTGTLVGGLCSILSCILVVKRWALLGDAMSHSVLPGVALSHILGLPYFLGALVAGVLAALGMGYLEQSSRLKADTSMGIVFTGLFALGVVLISSVRGQVNLYSILFGSLLTVTALDLTFTTATAAAVLAVFALLYPAISFWAFDPTAARVTGIPTRQIHYLMMLLLTATIVASLRTVGIIMVIAMLITPGATALLLTYRLSNMMLIAPALGILSSVVGLYLSYYLDLPTGAVMVLVASALFVLALCFSPSQGILAPFLRVRSSGPERGDRELGGSCK